MINLSKEIISSSSVLEKTKKYNKAVNLFGWKKYIEALGIFNSISSFRDSNEYIEKCSMEIYTEACYMLNYKKTSDSLETAANLFYLILDYKDSNEKYIISNKMSIEKRTNDLIERMDDSISRIKKNNFANYNAEKIVVNQCLTELDHLAKETNDKKILYTANKYREYFNSIVGKHNKDIKTRNIFIIIVIAIVIILFIIYNITK